MSAEPLARASRLVWSIPEMKRPRALPGHDDGPFFCHLNEGEKRHRGTSSGSICTSEYGPF